MDKCVHIISHSHWDREWYLPFEQHRMRLIELIDKCIELFENDPDFKSFHLDGQTIVLDDYLEIKPENRDKIIKYVKEGRFIVGPWYILQDEFLTSGESNVRNLLIGAQSAEKYGNMCRVGYFPDAFGNAGQMPQLLKQAGMEAVVFGRGVKPVGFDNEVAADGDYESVYSEMIWESPDGSALPGILFANWYNNGNEIPTDPRTAKEYWDRRLEDTGKFASTGEYLLMNGCDHQPVQADIGEAIKTASELYPDILFKHSNFPEYVEALIKKLPKDLSVIKGELTSQNTDGWVTLVNTASSRIKLKQMNRRCESALENVAEPIRVMASVFGKSYPTDELNFAWKMLMQNHPHDSICGCSVDEVHREMETRYDKSIQTASYLTDEGKEYIANQIDTSIFGAYAEKCIPFTVFNTTGRSRSKVVSVELDVLRGGAPLRNSADAMEKAELPKYSLINKDGDSIPCTIEDIGVTFGYTLPKDKFRQPYMARTVRVVFEAENVPAMGYTTYALAEKKPESVKTSLTTGINSMENEFIRVKIQNDGSIDLTDKINGKSYNGLCYYEETGDLGNEYIYKMPNGTEPIVTRGSNAGIEIVEDEPYRATYKVTNIMTVPESGDALFEYEKKHMVDFRDRQGGRSENAVELVIETYISLEKSGRGVRVRTVFDNKAKDHRVRVMIPTGIESEIHKADSVFELAERNNRHNECWKNPSGCEHQQSFVSIDDGKCGITVANAGLYEYEMLPEKNNTIAVTILRAVGEMGDWGVFPTPEAQMLGKSDTEIEIIPHCGGVVESLAYDESYQLRVDMPVAPAAAGKGVVPCEYSMLDWSGDGLTLTGMKAAQGSDDIIIRWVNIGNKPAVLSVKKTDVIDNMYMSNVIEKKLNTICDNGSGYFTVEVRPQEIITLGVSRD